MRKDIEDKLKKAEELVENIKDSKLKVKAFELVYAELTSPKAPLLPAATIESPKHVATKKEKNISIVEFVSQFTTKNDVDRVLVFGYFLEHNEGIENFQTKDIKNCFFKAKEKVPSNVPDKMQKNIGKGLIMESNDKTTGKKSYVLTRTGEERIEKLRKQE